MRLHILGCGDAFGSGGRRQSAYLVETSDRLFLLDCGPTALLSMKRAGFDPRLLDAIIISHLHGDHFAGVPFFFVDDLYRRPRQKPLFIAGPPGTGERIRELYRIMYGDGRTPAENPLYVFQVLRPNELQNIAAVEVFPFRVPHQTHDISLGLKVAYQGKQILFFRRFGVDRAFCRSSPRRGFVSLRMLVLQRRSRHAYKLPDAAGKFAAPGMPANRDYSFGRRHACAQGGVVGDRCGRRTGDRNLTFG